MGKKGVLWDMVFFVLCIWPCKYLESGSLVGCHLWGCTELDTTEATEQQQQQYFCHCGSDLI